MFTRQQHLSRIEVEEVVKKGQQAYVGPFFNMRCLKASEQKWTVSVSKKVAKTAVARNKIRRRLYSVFYTLTSNTAHTKPIKAHILVVVKSDISSIPFVKVQEEGVKAVNMLHSWQ
jgi:ribonuclease P protein component